MIAPAALAFTYSLTEQVSLTDPVPTRHVERWVVSVAFGESGPAIADAQVVIINLEADQDVGDFVDIATGEWRESPGRSRVDGAATSSRVLVLERVWVTPEYRGNGLGPVIAAVAIDHLGRGCRLAACYPAPIDGDDHRSGDRERSIEALGRIWAKVGFQPWNDGVWMIDLEASDTRGALDALLAARPLAYSSGADMTSPR